MRIRTILLWLMIAAFGLAAALGVVAILTLTIGAAEERMISTALMVGAFSLTALLCVIVLDRFKLVTMMWLGVAASGAALLLWLFVIWIEPLIGAGGFTLSDHMVKPAVTLTVLAIWTAHLGLLVLPRADSAGAQGTRVATVVLAGLFGVAIIACIWAERLDEEEGRILGVLLVLTILGTLVSPTLALVEAIRRRSHPEDIGSSVRIDVVCPRCGEAHRLQTGVRKCPTCRLRITIHVEEPRCLCGYLLYDIKGDTCPECGQAVSADQRWAAVKE